MGIRFVDGKKIFKCCLHFFILIYAVPAVLLLARLCMQFAYFAGTVAAGALIQTNTFSFCIFRTFLLFSERGKELFHVTHMQTLMLHYLKGLHAPFCFRSKRYQIRIPFCNVQKGIRYRMQNRKNPQKLKSIACGNQIPSCTLQKGVWLPLEQLQTVIKYPLEQMACRIRELQAAPINVNNIPLRELNFKF